MVLGWLGFFERAHSYDHQYMANVGHTVLWTQRDWSYRQCLVVGWLVVWLVSHKEKDRVESNETCIKDDVGVGWIVVVGWCRSWG